MPTTKQEKIAKAVVDNALSEQPKPMKEIMEKHGYATNTAKTPNQIIDSPGVQEAIAEYTSEMLGAFEAQGITPYKIAGKIKALLDSKKIIKIAGKDGETQIISEEDNVNAIDKGITHAAKFGIGGGYKKGNEQLQQQNIQVNIFNKPEIKELVGNFEEALKAELTKPEHNA